MKGFKKGTRVVVHVVRGNGVAAMVSMGGMVDRVTSGGAGWVRLDSRLPLDGVHPFPADDAMRGRWVLCDPGDCADEDLSGEIADSLNEER